MREQRGDGRAGSGGQTQAAGADEGPATAHEKDAGLDDDRTIDRRSDIRKRGSKMVRCQVKSEGGGTGGGRRAKTAGREPPYGFKNGFNYERRTPDRPVALARKAGLS